VKERKKQQFNGKESVSIFTDSCSYNFDLYCTFWKLRRTFLTQMGNIIPVQLLLMLMESPSSETCRILQQTAEEK